jgi:hypothetical protein
MPTDIGHIHSFHIIQKAAHSKWMNPLLSTAEKRKRKLSVKAAA